MKKKSAPEATASQPEETGKRVVSVDEAAGYCDVSPRTVYSWIRAGHVVSPVKGQVVLASAFNHYKLTRSVLDDVTKSAQAAKMKAETEKVKAEIEKTRAQTRAADRQHSLAVTADDWANFELRLKGADEWIENELKGYLWTIFGMPLFRREQELIKTNPHDKEADLFLSVTAVVIRDMILTKLGIKKWLHDHGPEMVHVKTRDGYKLVQADGASESEAA